MMLVGGVGAEALLPVLQGFVLLGSATTTRVAAQVNIHTDPLFELLKQTPAVHP